MARLDAHSADSSTDGTPLATNQNEAPRQTLSGLEAKVLLLISKGHQASEIAVALGTDQAAVREHIKVILPKAIDVSRQGCRPRIIALCPSEFSPEMESPFIA